MSAIAEPYSPRASAGDLERLSAQGCRYELIQGELQAMSPTGGPHGSATSRLTALAGSYVLEQELGECFAAETGFLIARNPDTVLAPDWAFIAEARLAGVNLDKFVACVPDIVLETRSPGDTPREIAAKAARWLQAGVKLVWDLDPETQELTVYRADGAAQILGANALLTGEDLLPGFALPIRRLFREPAA